MSTTRSQDILGLWNRQRFSHMFLYLRSQAHIYFIPLGWQAIKKQKCGRNEGVPALSPGRATVAELDCRAKSPWADFQRSGTVRLPLTVPPASPY